MATSPDGCTDVMLIDADVGDAFLIDSDSGDAFLIDDIGGNMWK